VKEPLANFIIPIKIKKRLLAFAFGAKKDQKA